MKIDRQKFFAAYEAAFGAITRPERKAGFDKLLGAAENDPQITDIRWLAYMLATVKHECADRWLPIEEFSKGKGLKYGNPVTVTDPAGRTYTNVYYGRGYVQLTWDYNYRSMGQKLGNRLLYEPSLALDADIAYGIMSFGMRTGSFKGAKLSLFINGGTCYYVNARKIINGLDQAERIAGYAQKLEAILRGFPWPKSMRWGSGTLRWVRPLKRIILLFDGNAIPLDIDGIAAALAALGVRRALPERVQTRRQRVDVAAVQEQHAHAITLDRANVQQHLRRRQATQDAAKKAEKHCPTTIALTWYWSQAASKTAKASSGPVTTPASRNSVDRSTLRAPT